MMKRELLRQVAEYFTEDMEHNEHREEYISLLIGELERDSKFRDWAIKLTEAAIGTFS